MRNWTGFLRTLRATFAQGDPHALTRAWDEGRTHRRLGPLIRMVERFYPVGHVLFLSAEVDGRIALYGLSEASHWLLDTWAGGGRPKFHLPRQPFLPLSPPSSTETTPRSLRHSSSRRTHTELTRRSSQHRSSSGSCPTTPPTQSLSLCPRPTGASSSDEEVSLDCSWPCSCTPSNLNSPERPRRKSTAKRLPRRRTISELEAQSSSPPVGGAYTAGLGTRVSDVSYNRSLLNQERSRIISSRSARRTLPMPGCGPCLDGAPSPP